MFKQTMTGCAALLSLAQASLYVVNPSELKDTFGKDAEVHSKLSNVGYNTIQKGTSRIGQVITPLVEDGQGCIPFDWERDFTEKEMQHFAKQEGFFLLLQRGGCSFAQKVKHAQEFGAEVVVISDFKNDDQAAQERNQINGKLDGTLSQHIPAFEIDWIDAKKMVDYIHEGEQVVYLKATMDVTNNENTVEVDLWYSTSLDLGMNLSTELAAMSLSFGSDHSSKPLFTPRISTYSCLNCADDFKRTNCMSNGVYCGYTPNFYKEYNLEAKNVSMTGKEVLTQALREKCLHKIMSEKYSDEGDLYWTFFGYLSKCFASEKPQALSFEQCYDWSTVMIQNNEEVDTLNNCVDNAFAIPGDVETDNSILREDRLWANANHIKLHPSVTINNSTFTNSTGQDLALSICAAYKEAPDECELSWQIKTFNGVDKYDGLQTPHETDELFEKAQVSAKGESEEQTLFGSWHLYAWIVGILIVNFAVMFIVRWRMKHQMRDQMNSSVSQAVSQYFALSGQDGQ